MASAVFQQARCARSGFAGEQRRKGPPKPAGSLRPSRWIHGVAVSALLTTGYVACIVGIRWLLALG